MEAQSTYHIHRVPGWALRRRWPKGRLFLCTYFVLVFFSPHGYGCCLGRDHGSSSPRNENLVNTSLSCRWVSGISIFSSCCCWDLKYHFSLEVLYLEIEGTTQICVRPASVNFVHFATPLHHQSLYAASLTVSYRMEVSQYRALGGSDWSWNPPPLSTRRVAVRFNLIPYSRSTVDLL